VSITTCNTRYYFARRKAIPIQPAHRGPESGA